MSPIINLLLYITLLLMVLTWPVTQYPIKIALIMGIWEANCLIPPTYAALMGGLIRTREGNESQHLRAFPNQNLVPRHYMLSVRWLQILEGLGHSGTLPKAIEQVLVMTNNIMTLVWTQEAP